MGCAWLGLCYGLDIVLCLRLSYVLGCVLCSWIGIELCFGLCLGLSYGLGSDISLCSLHDITMLSPLYKWARLGWVGLCRAGLGCAGLG